MPLAPLVWRSHHAPEHPPHLFAFGEEFAVLLIGEKFTGKCGPDPVLGFSLLAHRAVVSMSRRPSESVNLLTK